MVFLDSEMKFPDAGKAEEDGLLAIGGDLSIKRLLLAYRNGIFPWYLHEGVIFWFSPPQRMVLFPQELHVSRSMKQILRSGKFRITKNEAFEEVIALCAKVHEQEKAGTWISKEFVQAYNQLHLAGHAVSIESWREHALVGGLYGVVIGKIFCGESMFTLQPNASKAALITLSKSKEYELIDCQVETNHLGKMGARNIEREAYLKLLKEFGA